VQRSVVRFPVEVMPVGVQRVEYRVTAVGSVEAVEVVKITARLSGVVEKVRFAEGDPVQSQQIFAEIEPERYRIAMASARATLAKAQAEHGEAEIAARPSERGFLAYVVEDSVARERILNLGLRTASGWVEIRDGLKEVEQLVVRGADAISDGSPVLPQMGSFGR
jgi:multidrug efflux pump subunit AcrA (membrane-fusion protein)